MKNLQCARELWFSFSKMTTKLELARVARPVGIEPSCPVVVSPSVSLCAHIQLLRSPHTALSGVSTTTIINLYRITRDDITGQRSPSHKDPQRLYGSFLFQRFSARAFVNGSPSPANQRTLSPEQWALN